MISMLMYSHERRELNILGKIGRDTVCKISGDDWDFLSCSDQKQVFELLQEHPLIDISCVDVVGRGGVQMAETLRKTSKEMYMILLTDTSVSPVAYIRPTIMASSLLMRPLRVEDIKNAFFEAAKEILKRFRAADGKAFVIDTRDGKQLVPYERILFFESREKKIFINTGFDEYSFYDTLDNLEQQLPEGFERCHRSYIVATSGIKQIRLSQSMIVLTDESVIPLSRTYKNRFKRYR